MTGSCCYEIRIILSPEGLSWVGLTKPVQSSKPINDLDNLQPVETGCKISESQAVFRNIQTPLKQVEGVTEVSQEQVGTPPVLGLALAAAEELGIEPKQKEVFVNFMAACFPLETDEFYIKEWAGRFLRGFEKLYCDRRNLTKLLEIRQTLNGERPFVSMDV